MRKFLSAICLSMLLVTVLVPVGLALAAYNYSVSVRVFNNSATSYPNGLPVLVSINNSQLYDYGYISTTGLNTDVQEGATSRPFMVDSGYLGIFIPSFLGSQNRQISYRLGNTPAQTSFPIIIGVGGNITTVDAPAMEPSDNFTMKWSGYIDTANGTDKNLGYKPGAVKVFVSDVVSGNVTAIASASTVATRETYSGSNDSQSQVFGATWATQTFTSATGFFISSIQIYQYRAGAPGNVTASIRLVDTATGRPTGADLASGTVSANAWGAGPTWETVTLSVPYLIKAGISYALVFRAPSGDGANRVSWSYDNTAPTYAGGSYGSSADSGVTWGMTVGIDFNFITTGTLYATVTATGVSSGEKTVTLTKDSPFLSLNPNGAATPPVGTSGANVTLVMNVPLWQIDSSASPFTTVDSIGHTATVSGAVWTLNQGYDFDGTDDYIEIPHHASQLLTTGGSIEAWFKPDSAGENTEGRIVDKSASAAGDNGFRLQTGTSAVFIRIGGTAPGVVFQNSGAGSISYGTGAWYHVIATWDNTGYVTFYINSVVSGVPGISGSPALITTANALRIGNRSGATDRTFDGGIGEARLYNITLTPAQVLQNYNATKKKYTTGDIYTVSTLASVPDNANNWTFLQSNVMPYADNITLEVGGNLVAWYEPNTMVAGSILTDRAGGDNNGTINWGTNPAGIEVTVGALTASASTTSSSAEEAAPPDLLPDFPQSPTTPAPADAELVGMPQYDSMERFANSLRMPVRVAYVIAIWITCLVMGVAGTVAFGSVWGFIGGYGFGNVLALGTPVWPQMLLVAVLMVLLFGVFLWRHN